MESFLRFFWHPVCTTAELTSAAPAPLAVRLLDIDLAIADLGDPDAPRLAAVADRCLHRSTRLSVGWVDNCAIRCAYHGWRWAADGRCVEIPSMPDRPVIPGARLPAYEAVAACGLVWVRLDARARTTVPPCPAWDDPTMRVVAGEPYTWPTSAARRVENFVDLAHFPWVHAGTLGRRDEPVSPVPEVRRVGGELRFEFDPPDMATQPEALFGHSRYRMPMPLTVDIEFEMASGARRHLWMTASPVDAGTCRTFWFVARDDDTTGPHVEEVDAAHLGFQQLVLDQDEPVVCNQVPPKLPLMDRLELSVRTDRVSIEYRRWLRELTRAAASTHAPAALRRRLTVSRASDAGNGSVAVLHGSGNSPGLASTEC